MQTKFLAIAGATFALAAFSGTAFSQTSPTPSPTSAEIKMSPEGMQILCEKSPLNSRCAPSSEKPSINLIRPTEPDSTTAPSGTIAPGSTMPGDSMTPGGSMMTPGSVAPGSVAPGSKLPSTVDPGAATPAGANTPGSMNQTEKQRINLIRPSADPGSTTMPSDPMMPGSMMPGTVDPGATPAGANTPGSINQVDPLNKDTSGTTTTPGSVPAENVPGSPSIPTTK